MGFDGKFINYNYQFPSRAVDPIDKQDHIAITANNPVTGLTVGGASLYNVTFNDYAMVFNFTQTAMWNAGYADAGKPTKPVQFNGPIFTDAEDNLAPILAVKLKTNIAGLTKSDVGFTADSIALDFTGIKVTKYSYISIVVSFQKVIQGGVNNDTLTGTNTSELIIGGKGNDTIYGGAGNDLIEGDAGADKLYGGIGNDRFIFKSISDLGTDKTNTDTIYDLTKGDKLDFSKIDANPATLKNEAFSFIGTKDFSGKIGELRYEKDSSGTNVYGDIDGDKQADFVLHIDKVMSLSSSFFLV